MGGTSQDIKLFSIANIPYIIDNIEIIPYSLREIIQYGHQKYYCHLNILSINPDRIIQDLGVVAPKEITLLDVAFLDKELLRSVIEAFMFFLRFTEIDYVDHVGFIIDPPLNIKIINKQNVNKIIEIIKIQNCISDIEENEYNPSNEQAKRIKDKILASRKKVEEIKHKNNEDNSLKLLDLISIVSAKANGLNLFTVLDLNMYQLIDQFNRIKLIDDYEISIQALLHGADSKNIELKHWMSATGKN